MTGAALAKDFIMGAPLSMCPIMGGGGPMGAAHLAMLIYIIGKKLLNSSSSSYSEYGDASFLN